MDILLETSLETLLKSLKTHGFRVKREKNHFSCLREKKEGRDHIILANLGKFILCEIHWDNRKHFLCFGVDYQKRPLEVFHLEFKKEFEKISKVMIIRGGYSWFTRRNKSVYGGLKLFPLWLDKIMFFIYLFTLPIFILIGWIRRVRRNERGGK